VGRKRGWGAPRKLGSGRCEMMERIRQIAERGAAAGVAFPDFYTSAPSLADLNNVADTVAAGRKVRVQVWRETKGWRVEVFGETRPVKDVLKVRGYRFGPTARWEKKFAFADYSNDPVATFEAAVEEAIAVSEIMR
jgi:hypothetical protein